jgi:hypothetical protein
MDDADLVTGLERGEIFGKPEFLKQIAPLQHPPWRDDPPGLVDARGATLAESHLNRRSSRRSQAF